MRVTENTIDRLKRRLDGIEFGDDDDDENLRSLTDEQLETRIVNRRDRMIVLTREIIAEHGADAFLPAEWRGLVATIPEIGDILREAGIGGWE